MLFLSAFADPKFPTRAGQGQEPSILDFVLTNEERLINNIDRRILALLGKRIKKYNQTPVDEATRKLVRRRPCLWTRYSL